MNILRRRFDVYEEAIYNLLEMFQSMTTVQLYLILSKTSYVWEITPTLFMTKLQRLSAQKLIHLDEMTGEVNFTGKERFNEVVCDCVWVMMKHIEERQEEKTDVGIYDRLHASLMSRAARPFRLCYEQNGVCYFVAAINTGEEALVYVMMEYLRTIVCATDKNARVIIVVWNEETAQNIPRIPDFDTAVYMVTRQSYNEVAKPTVKRLSAKKASRKRANYDAVAEKERMMQEAAMNT